MCVVIRPVEGRRVNVSTPARRQNVIQVVILVVVCERFGERPFHRVALVFHVGHVEEVLQVPNGGRFAPVADRDRVGPELVELDCWDRLFCFRGVLAICFNVATV